MLFPLYGGCFQVASTCLGVPVLWETWEVQESWLAALQESSLAFTLWAQREECGMQHPLAGPVSFDLLLTAPRRP